MVVHHIGGARDGTACAPRPWHPAAMAQSADEAHPTQRQLGNDSTDYSTGSCRCAAARLLGLVAGRCAYG